MLYVNDIVAIGENEFSTGLPGRSSTGHHNVIFSRAACAPLLDADPASDTGPGSACGAKFRAAVGTPLLSPDPASDDDFRTTPYVGSVRHCSAHDCATLRRNLIASLHSRTVIQIVAMLSRENLQRQ